ncbi:MAG TPA: dihydrofolate reductase [Erysipelotrichaceae bacterium]|nr:dihydrofolate reductase [Erysipelotrichaceae bacterium]HQB31825.1 dihydrofolate reductase [Erysipelotrichaceae bacterium]
MFSFSVAFDPNRGIGINGVLPWHIREELQLFKKNTLHKNIVMGQTTYDRLPGKLKDRNIFVVSWDDEYHPENVAVIRDLMEFIEQHKDDETEYIICGGASIYTQAYPYCQKGYVSIMKDEYEVDAYLDCFEKNDWNIIEEAEYEKFIYYLLERKRNGID